MNFLEDTAKAGQVVVDGTGVPFSIATILPVVKKLDQN